MDSVKKFNGKKSFKFFVRNAIAKHKRIFKWKFKGAETKKRREKKNVSLNYKRTNETHTYRKHATNKLSHAKK